jgi:glycosyltransferase involved in cell wall biosynthesis
VETDSFSISEERGDYFLMVGQLVGYKKADLAVQAFNKMRKPLVVIGDGEQIEQLRADAGPTVHILGRQPFSVIQEHYARCRALVFPGVEDFGIVPLEAMASGRPVIAFAKGGALETVIDGVTGLLFNDQSITGLMNAVDDFEKRESDFDSTVIRKHAMKFDRKEFKEQVHRQLSLWLNKAKGRS